MQNSSSLSLRPDRSTPELNASTFRASTSTPDSFIPTTPQHASNERPASTNDLLSTSITRRPYQYHQSQHRERGNDAGYRHPELSTPAPQQVVIQHPAYYQSVPRRQPRANAPGAVHQQRHPSINEWLAYLLDHPERLAYAPLEVQETHCRDLDRALSILNRPTHDIPASVLRNWERAGKGMGPELMEALVRFSMQGQNPSL